MAFCLRFQISLLPFFSPLLEDLIYPRLTSQAKWLCISRTWKGLTSSFFLGRSFNKPVVFNCIGKKKWFCSFQKTNASLSVQSATTHSQSLRGCHNASLLWSSQVSSTAAPFLGAPMRRSASSSTHCGRT